MKIQCHSNASNITQKASKIFEQNCVYSLDLPPSEFTIHYWCYSSIFAGERRVSRFKRFVVFVAVLAMNFTHVMAVLAVPLERPSTPLSTGTVDWLMPLGDPTSSETWMSGDSKDECDDYRTHQIGHSSTCSSGHYQQVINGISLILQPKAGSIAPNRAFEIATVTTAIEPPPPRLAAF